MIGRVFIEQFFVEFQQFVVEQFFKFELSGG